MIVFYRMSAVALTMALLAGCQSLPQPSVSKLAWLDNPAYFAARSEQAKQRASWRYSAKVGLSTPQIKEQANLVWEFRDQVNSVRLYGPLGVGAIKLQFDEFGVVLSDNKGVTHRGHNAEELLTRIIGWPIPLDALSSWMFVLPAEGATFRYTLDQDQQIGLLEQLGWRIEFSDYKQYDEGLMPRKMVATKMLPSGPKLGKNSPEPPLKNRRVVVKLITKSWQ